MIWLESSLDSVCENEDIDFVFAQLHHPHKSELWTPGESNFTGQVIEVLESFTEECGKASIHFFGHTHGYSRGNSRDHKHLWINVATAGGAIDNWGEFPNFDYDEFSVSQDEYGFVSIEVTAGDDPQFTVKRIGRGDQDVIEDNILRDSVTINNRITTVDRPIGLSPKNVILKPECVILKANAFSSMDENSLHGQSHWQVSEDPEDFSNPVTESWKNFENWYFEEDTQAGDDLTDDPVDGLAENTDYWWRARYRDRELNWSEWSESTAFSTGASSALPNLLANPGAEDSIDHWIILEGVVESLIEDVCDGVSPHSGTKYFCVGGLCEHSEVARCIQNIPVASYADSIDAGNFRLNFGGFLANFGGSDLPEMRVIFLDSDSIVLGNSNTLSTLNPVWTVLKETIDIPALTRIIQVELKGTRNAGTDNDSYFDDLYLRLGTDKFDCSTTTSTQNQSARLNILQAQPNPTSSIASIPLPPGTSEKLRIAITKSDGSKVNCPITYFSDQIKIDGSGLASGLYLFWVRDGNRLIGSGKLVVQ